MPPAPADPDDGEEFAPFDPPRAPRDATPPVAGPGRDGPLPEDPEDGDILYATDAVHDIRVVLSEDAIASLRDTPDLDVPATLTWAGQDLDVALRLKGSASARPIDGKPSFKIDVHEFDADQRVDGAKRLTLNNMVQDRTMLREHSYYWLAARLGLPAPRHAYANVWVNDVRYGLYGVVETMDEQFIARAFADDTQGNLYEGANAADFTRENGWFVLDEIGSVFPAPDDMGLLIDTVVASRDGDRGAMLTENFDLETALTYWALDIVSGNPDGYVYNHHNYHAYHAPVAERWFLVPWGTDLSFLQVDLPPDGNAEHPVRGELMLACQSDPACAEALNRRVGEVLAVLETELLDFVEPAAARIAADCQADPRREEACDPEAMWRFIAERPAFLRGFL